MSNDEPAHNGPGPALENVFEEIQKAAPKMFFQTASSDPREEKVAEGLREELFACFLMATETARIYREAQMRPDGLDKETLSDLNRRATSLTIRLNNTVTALMEGQDPREIEQGPGDEQTPDDSSSIVT